MVFFSPAIDTDEETERLREGRKEAKENQSEFAIAATTRAHASTCTCIYTLSVDRPTTERAIELLGLENRGV